MEYHFWRIPLHMEDHQFVWILWYICKGKNNKVFNNLDMDPRDTFQLVETESTLWGEAQLLNIQKTTQAVAIETIPSIPGRW